MRLIHFLPILALLASCTATGAATGHQDTVFRAVTVEVGLNELTKADELDDGDATTEVGLGFLYQLSDDNEAQPGPKGLISEMGLHYTEGTDSVGGIGFEHQRADITLGLRYYWHLGPVQPYIGAGLQVGYAELDDGFSTEDAFAVGGYGRAGLDLPLGDEFRVGLDLRHSAMSDFDIAGEDTDLSATTLALTAGWSF